VVGPVSRAEYEALVRAKCAQLVSLGLNARSRVLDVGCGTGHSPRRWCRFLSRRDFYYGVDVAVEAVTFWQTRFPQPNFHFVRSGQTTIPIHGLQFDFIFLSSVFAHMFPADIALLLGELRRLMASNGSVAADACVSTTVAGHAGSRALIRLNEQWLLRQFDEHGFHYQEIGSRDWDSDCRLACYHLTEKRSDRRLDNA
jgi:ubiquinone/menaquinone biosynthesis C-methylase UbiE